MHDINELPTLEVGQYDPVTDTIDIEGVTYSGSLFRELGVRGFMPGTVLRIDKRDADGVLTVGTVEYRRTEEPACPSPKT